jgi:muramoyltetrapeptide carboxypeptidase
MMKINTIAPKSIEPGATFGIFSPSEPLSGDRVERMQPSLEVLGNKFGYKFASNARNDRGYVAGTVAECIADIVELLTDDDVDALIASWGGKNSNRLVRDLPYGHFAESRKPLIGFSDACVLLNAVTATTGLNTFYGPNIAGKLLESSHHDFRLLCGEKVPPFGVTASQHWRTLVPGSASGRLYGGNLGLSGSRAMAEMTEPIFFWESSSAPTQIIDQYLSCLKNCGFLDRVKAMIVGDVSFDEVPRKRRPVDDLLVEYGEELGIPVIRIETFGHRKMENPAIPIGAFVRLTTATQSITMEKSAVDLAVR